MARASNDRVGVLVRLAPGTHRRLKALARRDHRSVNWEIEQACTAWIEQRADRARRGANDDGEGSKD